jgi:hypothetical protein
MLTHPDNILVEVRAIFHDSSIEISFVFLIRIYCMSQFFCSFQLRVSFSVFYSVLEHTFV